jgi:DNA-binding XRE family transcriptional regulator
MINHRYHKIAASARELAASGKGTRLCHFYQLVILPTMQTKPFSNNLREYRKKAGLRQIDVAQKLGLDCADRLSRWENGSAMPNVVNLFKLAALYKASPHELYQPLYHSTAGKAEHGHVTAISQIPP